MNQPTPPPLPGKGNGWDQLGSMRIQGTPPPEARRFMPNMFAHGAVVLCTAFAVAVFGLGLGLESPLTQGAGIGAGLSVGLWAWLVGWVAWKCGASQRLASVLYAAVAVALVVFMFYPRMQPAAAFDRDLVDATGYAGSRVDAATYLATEFGDQAAAPELAKALAPLQALLDKQSDSARSKRVQAALELMRRHLQVEVQLAASAHDVRESERGGPNALVDRNRVAELRVQLETLKTAARDYRADNYQFQIGLRKLFVAEAGPASRHLADVLAGPAFSNVSARVDQVSDHTIAFANAEIAAIDYLGDHRDAWKAAEYGGFVFSDERALAQFNARVDALQLAQKQMVDSLRDLAADRRDLKTLSQRVD